MYIIFFYFPVFVFCVLYSYLFSSAFSWKVFPSQIFRVYAFSCNFVFLGIYFQASSSHVLHLLHDLHEGSAFRCGPPKVSTKALPFILAFPRRIRRLCLSFLALPRCPRRLCLSGSPFNPFGCFVQVCPSGSFIELFFSKRTFLKDLRTFPQAPSFC